MDHVNIQVKILESLMSKQRLDGGWSPEVIMTIDQGWILGNPNPIP